MNSVQLLGNLARDPEIRFTKTGRAVAMFTVFLVLLGVIWRKAAATT